VWAEVQVIGCIAPPQVRASMMIRIALALAQEFRSDFCGTLSARGWLRVNRWPVAMVPSRASGMDACRYSAVSQSARSIVVRWAITERRLRNVGEDEGRAQLQPPTGDAWADM